MKSNQVKNKNKELSDIGIRTFGIKEIKEMGMSAFLNFTDEHGLSIITNHNRPRSMVMPFSILGLKKVFMQINELYSDVNVEDAIIVSTQELLNSINKILEDIE